MPGPFPEYMMRVKLPSSSAFHSSPSGDSDYEDAFQQAIAAALPAGFEPCRPRLNEKWPVDSEGLTWVPLYQTSKQNALDSYITQVRDLEAKLARIKKAVGK